MTEAILTVSTVVTGALSAFVAVIGQTWRHEPALRLWQRPTRTGWAAIGCIGLTLGFGLFQRIESRETTSTLLATIRAAKARAEAQATDLRYRLDALHDELRESREERLRVLADLERTHKLLLELRQAIVTLPSSQNGPAADRRRKAIEAADTSIRRVEAARQQLAEGLPGAGLRAAPGADTNPGKAAIAE